MKRFIAILIAIQIGFTPFCSVLAMEPTQATIGFTSIDCSMHEAQQHPELSTSLSKSIPQLSCCESKNHQGASAQASLSFEIPYFTNQVNRNTYSDTLASQPFLPDTIRAKHPPDDFERLSQSKRE